MVDFLRKRGGCMATVSRLILFLSAFFASSAFAVEYEYQSGCGGQWTHSEGAAVNSCPPPLPGNNMRWSGGASPCPGVDGTWEKFGGFARNWCATREWFSDGSWQSLGKAFFRSVSRRQAHCSWTANTFFKKSLISYPGSPIGEFCHPGTRCKMEERGVTVGIVDPDKPENMKYLQDWYSTGITCTPEESDIADATTVNINSSNANDDGTHCVSGTATTTCVPEGTVGKNCGTINGESVCVNMAAPSECLLMASGSSICSATAPPEIRPNKPVDVELDIKNPHQAAPEQIDYYAAPGSSVTVGGQWGVDPNAPVGGGSGGGGGGGNEPEGWFDGPGTGECEGADCGGAGSHPGLPFEEAGQVVEFSSGLATDMTCPTETVSAMGITIPIPWQPACDFVTALRPLVIGLAYLSAVYILIGYRPSGGG